MIDMTNAAKKRKPSREVTAVPMKELRARLDTIDTALANLRTYLKSVGTGQESLNCEAKGLIEAAKKIVAVHASITRNILGD